MLIARRVAGTVRSQAKPLRMVNESRSAARQASATRAHARAPLAALAQALGAGSCRGCCERRTALSRSLALYFATETERSAGHGSQARPAKNKSTHTHTHTSKPSSSTRHPLPHHILVVLALARVIALAVRTSTPMVHVAARARAARPPEDRTREKCAHEPPRTSAPRPDAPTRLSRDPRPWALRIIPRPCASKTRPITTTPSPVHSPPRCRIILSADESHQAKRGLPLSTPST
jgi:hypothetical protein